MAGRHRRVDPPRRSSGLLRVLAGAVVAALILSAGTALGLLPEPLDPREPTLAAAPASPPPVPPLPLPLRPPKPPVVITTTTKPPPTTTRTREVVRAEEATSTPEAEPTPTRTTTTSKPPPPPPPPPPPEPSGSCPTELKGTRPHVAQVGHHIAQRFDVPLSQIGGFRASGRDPQGHPAGLALDWTVGRAKGDAIADYLLANQGRFAVRYVIWQQRYNDGSGWDPMADRGSDTANHLDHVHASFEASGPVDVSC